MLVGADRVVVAQAYAVFGAGLLKVGDHLASQATHLSKESAIVDFLKIGLLVK